jgi:hypothetical protein
MGTEDKLVPGDEEDREERKLQDGSENGTLNSFFFFCYWQKDK